MKMYLKGFCKQLARAKEEETVSTKGGNKYLLEQVFQPLAQNKKVLVKDIDFSKFDADDVQWLYGYCESLEKQGRKLAALVGTIGNIKPVACKVRQFC